VSGRETIINDLSKHERGKTPAARAKECISSFLSVRNEQAFPLFNDAAAIRVRQPSQFYDR